MNISSYDINKYIERKIIEDIFYNDSLVKIVNKSFINNEFCFKKLIYNLSFAPSQDFLDNKYGEGNYELYRFYTKQDNALFKELSANFYKNLDNFMARVEHEGFFVLKNDKYELNKERQGKELNGMLVASLNFYNAIKDKKNTNEYEDFFNFFVKKHIKENYLEKINDEYYDYLTYSAKNFQTKDKAILTIFNPEATLFQTSLKTRNGKAKDSNIKNIPFIDNENGEICRSSFNGKHPLAYFTYSAVAGQTIGKVIQNALTYNKLPERTDSLLIKDELLAYINNAELDFLTLDKYEEKLLDKNTKMEVVEYNGKDMKQATYFIDSSDVDIEYLSVSPIDFTYTMKTVGVYLDILKTIGINIVALNKKIKGGKKDLNKVKLFEDGVEDIFIKIVEEFKKRKHIEASNLKYSEMVQEVKDAFVANDMLTYDGFNEKKAYLKSVKTLTMANNLNTNVSHLLNSNMSILLAEIPPFKGLKFNEKIGMILESKDFILNERDFMDILKLSLKEDRDIYNVKKEIRTELMKISENIVDNTRNKDVFKRAISKLQRTINELLAEHHNHLVKGFYLTDVNLEEILDMLWDWLIKDNYEDTLEFSDYTIKRRHFKFDNNISRGE